MTEKSDPRPNQKNRRGENTLSKRRLLSELLNAIDSKVETKQESIEQESKYKFSTASEDPLEFKVELECFILGETDSMPSFPENPKKPILFKNAARRAVGDAMDKKIVKPPDFEDRIRAWNDYSNGPIDENRHSEYESLFKGMPGIYGE